jgi:hypothetical protein
MRGSQSSATQIDDHRKTSKRPMILPQAMREVQAIREVGQEKLSGDDGKGLGYVLMSVGARSQLAKRGRG